MNTTLRKLRDFNPTCFDSRANYMGDRSHDHWYMLDLSLERDAGLLSESNWYTAVKMLKADKTPGCEIHRFGHWACGWYELILIHPWRRDLIAIAEDIERSLSDYPVLDDDDYSQRQWEGQDEAWESWARHEFAQELEDRFGVSMDNVPAESQYDLFTMAAEKANEYWEDHDTGGMYIRVNRVAEEVSFTDLLFLPSIQLDASGDDIPEIGDQTWHTLISKGISRIARTDGSYLDCPIGVYLSYSEKQVNLL